MIFKNTEELFKTVIIPIVGYTPTQANFKPETVIVTKNNTIVSDFISSPVISNWKGGYNLTFMISTSLNDIVSCLVPVELGSDFRFFSEYWSIIDTDSDTILTNVLSVNRNNKVIPGVYIYITDDVSGNNKLFEGYSDSNGVLSVSLKPGRYYRWVYDSDNPNFSNPYSFEVKRSI